MGEPLRLNRRTLLGTIGLASMGSLLVACSQAAAPTPTAKPAAGSSTAPTTAPKPTTAPSAAATAAPAQKAASSAQKVELKYQSREPETAAGKQQLWNVFYPKFQATNPNISVKFLPTPTNLFEQTVSSMVAGTAADIIEMCCEDTAIFIQKGDTLNLQPYMNQDAKEVDLSDYMPHQFDAWKDEKGNIHLVPRFTGTMVLYYNKDMFAQKGVPDLPTDWEKNIDFSKYEEIGKHFVNTKGLRTWATSSYGIGADGNAWITQIFLRGYGTNMVNPEDHNRTDLASDKAQQCLEMLRKWIWDDNIYAEGNAMGGQDVLSLFLSGRLAMMEMGDWNLDPVMQGAKFKWDVAPFPDGPAGHTTHQSVDGSFIWNKTKYPDQSWTLLKATISPDYGRLLIQYDGKLPSRLSLGQDFTKIMRQQNAKYNDIHLEVFTDSHKLGIGRPEEMFNNEDTCVNTILKPVFDKVFLLGKAPVSLIAKAVPILEDFNAGKIGIQDIGNRLKAIGVG